MRILSSIDPNTLKCYELHTVPASAYGTLQSYSFEKWDENLPKALQEICIEVIAQNWKEHPILDEIILPIDRYHLVDILSTDLPLTLTIPKIEDDIYWRRCYIERWPKQIPPHVQKVEIFDIIKINDMETRYSIYSLKEDNGGNGDPNGNKLGNSSRRSSRVSNRRKNSEDSTKNGLKSWKEYYIEMHVRDYLEGLKPENYDAEKLKELSDLCSPYVKVLNMAQMQCHESSCSRIPLNSILTGFQYLKELNLCFKQTYVGEEFSWNVVRTSQQDIKLLTKGLEKLRLRVLRIQNSDINDEKVTLILKSLLKHDLEILDFTHCKISDEGMLAVSKFILEVPVTELILMNNKINVNGIETLSYCLLQETCKIKYLNLKLNQFSDEGATFLLGALEEYGKTIKSLSIAGCGLTKNVSLEKVVTRNNTLEIFDISNNRIGEYVGQEILEAMKHNITIKKFDMRMCEISSETEYAIQVLVDENSKNKRKLPKTFYDDGEKFFMNMEKIIMDLYNIFLV